MELYSHEETQVTGAFGSTIAVVSNGNLWTQVSEDDLYENTTRYIAAGYKSVAFTKGSIGQMTKCYVSEMSKNELKAELDRIHWCYGTLIYDLANDKF